MAYLNESHIEVADINFFTEKLGYTHINAWEKKLMGRETLKDVVLIDRLRSSLENLNKNLPSECIDHAIYELTKSRATLTPIIANKEVYELIKNGIQVEYKNALGREENDYVKVIDFNEKTANDFPLFAKVQNDLPRFRIAYKQIMQMVLFAITPVIVLMGILAKPLILFLFTDKWIAVVPIFQIICITGILYPIHFYNLLVLQVRGKSALYLKIEVYKKFLLCAILFCCYFFGFYALLWGQLLFSVLSLLINTHFAGQVLEYSMVKQLKDISPIFAFAVPMALGSYFFVNVLSESANIIQLVGGSFVGLLIYFGLVYLFKFETIADIKKMIFKR